MKWAAVLCALGAPVAAQQIMGAEFTDPTTRYDHAILGDAVEWGDLRITTTDGQYRMPLPDTQVYEDLNPRLWDVTGDGQPEVVVVQTDIARGARLLVIGMRDGQPQPLPATPFIGRTYRWLAPLGAADFDGDGRIEVALVDRPHLARTLQFWRLDNGSMQLVAALDGVTNHRIGDDTIPGGVSCDGTAAILMSADWSRIVSVALDGGTAIPRDLGPNVDGALAAALAC
ncbi:VCBS repeat-containing protein [Loktanella sp. SALINAS62]|uniref:FG-GAP repeat domain-containing protein n=1 Tax=Loktanella sp. SALINAS62 TaxID=2706124 RepID=UPI001B8BAD42|nr:VCBS repeat-containing protein [Loktanella sp. SALINAS62]MBS1303906.1 VCBS repeat-containing protein [Loktanella sp. SALINAS62]